MCGIAGVLYRDDRRPVEISTLEAMAGRLAHRGPDAAGYWHDTGVALAHRRLSIIDLAGGGQPLANEDGSLVVVLNGEIYNHATLRDELRRRGHTFRSRSDTEVLVHLYEEHGDALIDRLRGMFAFALWDHRRRRLLLARDRVGIKPLYFYRDAEKLVFGSEIKAILEHPGVSRDIHLGALEQYLGFGCTWGAQSIFQKIERLPPAHLLVLSAADLGRQPQRYWSLSIQPDPRPRVEEWCEALVTKIDETVRVHLAADVPIGAFLSGGIDSSVIVATAAHAAPLQTFSIGFHDERYDELPHAREVATHFGTQHVERIAASDAAQLIDDLSYYCDEPFADASAIPSLMVARIARDHVKVALSGDGGDEAFGGYTRYVGDSREAALRRLLPPFVRRHLVAAAARHWPDASWLGSRLRGRTLLTNLTLEAGDAYANTLAMCRMPLRRQLLAPDVAATLNGADPGRPIADSYRAVAGHGPSAAMMAADLAVRLPDDYLVKVDRASMACGLEVRPPFLDHELLELAARIPPQLKVRHGVTKWILKRSYRARLPRAVTRRRKQGFEVPINEWLKGPLRPMLESELMDANSVLDHLINRQTARRVYQDHLSGRGRYGHVLWTVLMLARWSERYVRGSGGR
jgi:asparagine synthase (glutamine-hydrolysing)